MRMQVGSPAAKVSSPPFGTVVVMHRLYFPLRTSVELFPDPESVDAVTRVKEAAILYDEVYIETGLFEASITSGGSFQTWLPHEHLTPEHLAQSRRLPPPGAGFAVSMGIEETPGEPASTMHPILGGPLSVAYAAEFHRGIIDELAKDQPEWVKFVAVPDDELNQSDLARLISKLNFEMLDDAAFMPDAEHFVRDFVYKMFHRDAVVAAYIGAAFNVTSLFAPMLERSGASLDRAGESALAVLVPNLAHLPWEAVLEYRDHAGSVEAREKLRIYDQRAAATDPEDLAALQLHVFQDITTDLLAAIRELQGSAAQRFGEEAAKTAVSFIPVAGPFLGPGASLLELLRDVLQERQSWHAALMKLRSD